MRGHYVYKYVDAESYPVYIGKCDSVLIQRYNAHKLDPYGSLDFYWAELSGAQEADLMETLLINKYTPKYNIMKKLDGISMDVKDPEWKTYSEMLSVLKNKKVQAPTIHNRLREVRTINGLTQADVAAAMGKTDVAVYQWETGRRLPPYDVMLMLSDFYGLPVDYLFYREEESDAKY